MFLLPSASRVSHARPARYGCVLACWVCLCFVWLLLPVDAVDAGTSRGSTGLAYSVQMHGRFAVFSQAGFEPDGDPIDRAVISATLHDAKLAAYPDCTLVLSMYLENFLPRTAPELPDLLHPNKVATSLAGFFQGKAALVRGDGHIAFWGSVLAESFFDNSVHVALALSREGAAADEPPLDILGSFKVDGTLSLGGNLHATDGLTRNSLAALQTSAYRHVPVSWQSVVSNLTVAVPRMMGTGGTGSPGTSSGATDLSSAFAQSAQAHIARAPAPAARPSSGSPAWQGLPAAGAGLAIVAAAGLLTWARRRRHPARSPGAG
jgi:hypothetical protein